MAIVTIGIPTYNRVNLLRRALESALAQTFHDIEILVCDNGSTDDTVAVVRSYGDPRVRLVQQGINRGGNFNFNTAVRQARSELVLLLCDDDFLEPLCIEALLEPWGRPGRIAFSYGQYWLHTGAERTLLLSQGPAIEDGFGYVRGWWHGARATMLHGALFRREDLLSIGGFPPLNAGDTWVALRIALQGDVAFVARPVTNYQLQSGSLTHTLNDELHLRERRLLLQMCLTEAQKIGIADNEILGLEAHANRGMAVGAVSILLRAAEAGHRKREIARECRELWSYLRHRIVLAIAGVVIALSLPPSLIGVLRRVARRIRALTGAVSK
jgi:GT2 family glycosyltransferase